MSPDHMNLRFRLSAPSQLPAVSEVRKQPRYISLSLQLHAPERRSEEAPNLSQHKPIVFDPLKRSRATQAAMNIACRKIEENALHKTPEERWKFCEDIKYHFRVLRSSPCWHALLCWTHWFNKPCGNWVESHKNNTASKVLQFFPNKKSAHSCVYFYFLQVGRNGPIQKAFRMPTGRTHASLKRESKKKKKRKLKLAPEWNLHHAVLNWDQFLIGKGFYLQRKTYWHSFPITGVPQVRKRCADTDGSKCKQLRK